METISIHIKCFATVKDTLGFEEKELLIAPKASIEDVISMLSGSNPSLLDIKETLLYAVNEEYEKPSYILNNHDVLAIFPPVSGG